MCQVLYDQFMAKVDEGGTDLTPGIDCEVGKVFPWCVSVGGMSLKLTDALHGTGYRFGYYRWLDWYKENLVGGATTPDGPYQWASIYYDRDIPYNMNAPQHQVPGNWICCAYQIAMDDETTALRLWEGAKQKFMIREPDGSAHINFPAELAGGAEDLVGFGAAVAFAAEFGDNDALSQLLRYAQDHYEPTRCPKEREFYYQFGLGEPWPRGWPNDWLLMSIAGGVGSWRKIFNEPNIKKFYQPTVVGVPYPALSVRQAFYDEAIGRLIVSTAPSGGEGVVADKATFHVKNLTPGSREVVIDGGVSTDYVEVSPTEIAIDVPGASHTFVIR
jgi:hypothetical protein